MSTIATIMTKLETLGTGFKHTFTEAGGEVVVFQSVKAYTLENFNRAAKDLLMVTKPALVIVYGGSTYTREGKTAAVSATRKAVVRRVADFLFFIADEEKGFEGKDEAAFGGGAQAKGAVVILDLWRDYLALVDPVKDWSLPIAPFSPVNDEPLPIDPDLGDVAAYALTMKSNWLETASAG